VSKINGLKNVSIGGVVTVCKEKDSLQNCSEELISKLGEDYEVSCLSQDDHCSKCVV
jgi:hypothetical protein